VSGQIGDAQVFLERMLQLLAQGGFVSTYKYAVLLALIDLCVEHGSPPLLLTTPQLARRVLELYWLQARPFSETAAPLRQSSGHQASVLRLILEFQSQNGMCGTLRPDRFLPPDQRHALATLLREIEWVLVQFPLPRLQRVGGGEERFIYEIGWTEAVSRADFLRAAAGGAGFDNRLLLVPGAAGSLIALAPVLRPLIRQQWLAKIQALNNLEERRLEQFLFGAERAPLLALRPHLQRFQAGACFYCEAPLREPGEIDHFLPFSRYPDEGIDNLVLAHARCNRNKLDFLADLPYADRWKQRAILQSADLDSIADLTGHPRDTRRTLGVAAGMYRGLPEGVRLWGGLDRLRRLDSEGAAEVRRFADGLL